MKQLLRTVAVLISILSPIFANTVSIEPNGNEDYLDDCGNYNLTLQSPNVDVIDERFISFPMIKCLTIKNSTIEKIQDGAFDQMPNLSYLNLQGNSIPSGNLFSFGNLSSLRKLILSNQNIKSTNYNKTVIRGRYPQLRYLYLKKTGIHEIETVQKNSFPELRYLDLSQNKLMSFNFMDWQADKLTHLYLNDNLLFYFSVELPTLLWLVLDNQYILIIGKDGVNLNGLTNLKNLSLRNNVIESIRDEAFRDTVSLQYLDISMNSLSTIHPETFRNLQSLQVLILDQNSFEEVPIIAVPLNITYLSMNCNRIKNLTINSLCNLPQLKTLSLTGNIITDVHTNAFLSQEMLEELYLNNNELSYLPNEWCQPMKNIRHLDLSGNKFTIFEPMLYCSAPSLQQIHVKHNPLMFIKANPFATLPENATVYLESDSNRTNIICRHKQM